MNTTKNQHNGGHSAQIPAGTGQLRPIEEHPNFGKPFAAVEDSHGSLAEVGDERFGFTPVTLGNTVKGTVGAPVAVGCSIITIRVEGGVIQEVEDVPAGVTVRVVDYDNDETTDDAGTPCSIEFYEGGAQ